jgi:hypothetical protein
VQEVKEVKEVKRVSEEEIGRSFHVTSHAISECHLAGVPGGATTLHCAPLARKRAGQGRGR